jgi:hypothetical protein
MRISRDHQGTHKVYESRSSSQALPVDTSGAILGSILQSWLEFFRLRDVCLLILHISPLWFLLYAYLICGLVAEWRRCHVCPSDWVCATEVSRAAAYAHWMSKCLYWMTVPSEGMDLWLECSTSCTRGPHAGRYLSNWDVKISQASSP